MVTLSSKSLENAPASIAEELKKFVRILVL